MHKLTIRGPHKNDCEVLLDGEPIEVTSLDLEIRGGKEPVVRLEIMADVEIEGFEIPDLMLVATRNAVTGEIQEEKTPLPFP